MQPIAGAAFQGIQAVGGCCSPSVALHLWTKGVAGNLSELHFFFPEPRPVSLLGTS